jgi:RNA polymerase sigma-70 factor (ECF subfamily)
VAELNFEELLKTYGTKVFNLAYRISGNREDAEDITQETFLQVHKNLSSYRGDSQPFTWIYRIALNNCLKLKRRLDRAYLDSLDEKIEAFAQDVPEEVRQWQQDPEKRYLLDELIRDIRQECYYFMSFRLTDEQRVVYILRHVLDLSYRGIAEILEISESVVKVRLHRAKNNLVDYFRSRCRWFDRDNLCSCESRIGFALAYAPDLMERVRARASKREMEDLIASTADQIPDIDRVYRELPQAHWTLQEKIHTVPS